MNATATETRADLAELQAMIRGTIDAYHDTKERWKAMKAIQWRLRGPAGQYVGNKGFWTLAFVPEANALIFDGRDNEAIKLRFYESVLGPLTIEILPQIR